MSKTNAIRILELKGIEFQTVKYDFNENELDAASVAKKVKAEPETVFKTLVARGKKTGINVFCIPGNYELNLKKAAKVSGNKSIELIKVKELLPLMGYIRGGCSPIGMKKKYPTFIDETAQLFEKIYISAGVIGTQIIISPNQLSELIESEFVDLI